MDSSLTLIIVLVVLIIASAYFSATETAISSINKIRIKNLAANGNKKAKLVLSLSEDYDRVLSTILIGNNIVNIASASLATVLFVKYFDDAGVTISTVVMTVLVLIFGEISPKSMAKEAPESFSMFSAPLLKFLTIILTPINFLFMGWKKLLSKIFKVSDERGITEEELITMVEEASEEGGLNPQECELIRSAIEFNDIEVADILTPRIDMVAIASTQSKEEIEEVFIESGYSRLPVYEDSIDNIIGVIHQKDLFCFKNEAIQSIIKPAFYIAYSTKISNLLKTLQRTKSHIAIVTDEYGGTMGMVTLEDILEELVGEIWDEHDEIVNEFEKISDNEYKISCNANLDKMFKLFEMNKDADAATVSGWVMDELGKIPNEGDSFSYDDLHITVSKTDYRRVLEIHVKKEEKIA